MRPEASDSGASNPPRRTPGVRLHRSRQENLLIDTEDRRLCVANDTAVALWELCDGETLVVEMVEAIRQVWSVDQAAVTDDIARALAALEEVGAIQWRGVGRGGPA